MGVQAGDGESSGNDPMTVVRVIPDGSMKRVWGNPIDGGDTFRVGGSTVSRVRRNCHHLRSLGPNTNRTPKNTGMDAKPGQTNQSIRLFIHGFRSSVQGQIQRWRSGLGRDAGTRLYRVNGGRVQRLRGAWGHVRRAAIGIRWGTRGHWGGRGHGRCPCHGVGVSLRNPVVRRDRTRGGACGGWRGWATSSLQHPLPFGVVPHPVQHKPHLSGIVEPVLVRSGW